MGKSNRAQKFHFTKTSIMALPIPESGRYEVFDDELRGMGCRITSAGKRMFFIYKKVGNIPTRRNLGEYLPGGPDSKTVEDFRKKAHLELGKIHDNPAQWLEGRKIVEAAKITIEDAFDMTLKATKRGRMALLSWDFSRKVFVEWLKKYPHIRTWSALRRHHIREYLIEARKPRIKKDGEGKENAVDPDAVKELSANSIRLKMQPLAQVGRHMWLEYEIPNVCERLGTSSALAKPPSRVYVEDVVSLLEYLRKNNMPMLEAGVALSGLAGLALLEVTRLEWRKVDLKRGLIEVSGEVKNPFRARVIPIPERCVEALQRAWNTRGKEGIQDINGKVAEVKDAKKKEPHVVESKTGVPFLEASWCNYSKLVRKQIEAWNPAMRKQMSAKDLRNCILTLGALKGFSGDILEQYVGHSPKTVTARNYLPRLTSAGEGEKKELERQMSVFRQLVVAHIDAAVESAGKEQSAKMVFAIGDMGVEDIGGI